MNPFLWVHCMILLWVLGLRRPAQWFGKQSPDGATHAQYFTGSDFTVLKRGKLFFFGIILV